MKKLTVIDRCCAPLPRAVSDGEAAELEQTFRALADRHRVKIISLLSQTGGAPICVCDFVPVLALAQPTVSYHLKQLVDAGLVTREKRGTYAYFRLAPDALERMRDAFGKPSEPAVDRASPVADRAAARTPPLRKVPVRTGGASGA